MGAADGGVSVCECVCVCAKKLDPDSNLGRKSIMTGVVGPKDEGGRVWVLVRLEPGTMYQCPRRSIPIKIYNNSDSEEMAVRYSKVVPCKSSHRSVSDETSNEKSYRSSSKLRKQIATNDAIKI